MIPPRSRYQQPVIVSLHIPKTGGQSFRARLEATYGPRLHLDYGDWEELDSPDIVARRASRIADARARADHLDFAYDVIHGHFKADKYLGLFRETRFVAFFRDPYQQAISHYRFFARHPEIEHPAVKAFHARATTMSDFVATFPNIQSLYLGSLRVEDLAMVGLMERYDDSLALFEAVSGRALAAAPRENVNPQQPDGEPYAVDAETRDAVDRFRRADLDLYRSARARFEELRARHGI